MDNKEYKRLLTEIKLIQEELSSMDEVYSSDENELMDAERILINPLNRSSSKQQYSFSKA